MTIEQAVQFQNELKQLLHLNTIYRRSLIDAFNSGQIKHFGEIVIHFHERAAQDSAEILKLLAWINKALAQYLKDVQLEDEQ